MYHSVEDPVLFRVLWCSKFTQAQENSRFLHGVNVAVRLKSIYFMNKVEE